MDDRARLADALEHMTLARRDAVDAANHPDPVERRRLMVRMAVRFRAAADSLDDQGRLTA